MSDTTDINSLPINPAAGDNNSLPNIVMNKNEIIDNKLEHLNQSRQQDLRNMHGSSTMQNEAISNALDQTIINKLITGIQQASINGLTSLPSSHIQRDTNSLTSDPQIRPNYIPPNNNNSDYIKNETMNDDIISHHMRKQNKQDTLDIMYDELQIPVFIAILYFAFQLPLVRKYLFSFFPSLFNNDGNPKLSGYVFNSLLFAFIFYVIKNILTYLTNI